jgi:hypothetical protein
MSLDFYVLAACNLSVLAARKLAKAAIHTHWQQAPRSETTHVLLKLEERGEKKKKKKSRLRHSPDDPQRTKPTKRRISGRLPQQQQLLVRPGQPPSR